MVRLTGLDTSKVMLVSYDAARDADWTVEHHSRTSPRPIGHGPLVVAWIMSPPGANSGGHQNIFRFMEVLERAGHQLRVYLYSPSQSYSSAEVADMVKRSSSYPTVAASIEPLPTQLPSDIDVIFATGWETAYPSFLDQSDARRLYFVQDFEPAFYAAGSEAVLAENTYRFGFTGITAGNWLAQKLEQEFGMSTTSFDFGADRSHYRLTNRERRHELFFYARPATERRGFELGIMALDLVAKARPDVVINLVGEDLRYHEAPFAARNLHGLEVGGLNAVYNRCAAGLVLSFTNMSLLPLELLAAGVVPVVNDGPNNRLVTTNPFIEFVPPSPRMMADRLLTVLDRGDLPEHSAAASMSVEDADWALSGEQFIAGFERSLRG
jgi:O-antigen biosynthesis protein